MWKSGTLWILICFNGIYFSIPMLSSKWGFSAKTKKVEMTPQHKIPEHPCLSQVLLVIIWNTMDFILPMLFFKLGRSMPKHAPHEMQRPFANPSPLMSTNNLHSLFACFWDVWGVTKASWNHVPMPNRLSCHHLDSVSLLPSFEESQMRAGVREAIVIGEIDDFWQLVKPAAPGLFHHNPRPAYLLQNLQQHNLHSFAGTEQKWHMTHVSRAFLSFFVQSQNAEKQVETRTGRKFRSMKIYSKRSAKPYSRPASWPRKPCHPMLPRGVPMWTSGVVSC